MSVYFMRVFVLFPTTLFEDIVEILKSYDRVFILEDEIYFTRYQNDIKIVFLLSAISYYISYCKENGVNVERTRDIVTLKKFKEIHFFDPTDHILTTKINLVLRQSKLTKHDTPLFLLKYNEIVVMPSKI